MQYKPGPCGILVPVYNFPSSRRTGPDYKPANRKKTAERGRRLTPSKANDLRYFAEHIRGRCDAAAEVLIDIAFVKSRGWVREAESVATTGAVYQDAKGTELYPRAHRFPCNPMFGFSNLPDLASFSSFSLRNELKAPLAITDPLPVLVNYVDRLFEAVAAAHVERAVRWILVEQPKNRDVHQSLIRHVFELDLLPAFLRSYVEAREVLQDRTDDQLPDMLTAGPISDLTAQHLTQLFQGMVVDPDAPSASIEAAAFLLEGCTDLHQSYTPPLEMDKTIARLDTLSKDPDIAASYDRLRTAGQVAKRPVAR